MARIKNKNTKPELIIRKLLWKEGLRYRLHLNDVPGKPDIVFKKQKLAIFIHGCFWHRHGCKYSYYPKSNQEFWKKKFEVNIARDAKIQRKLIDEGWHVIVLWECEIEKKPDCSIKEIKMFLGKAGKQVLEPH